MTSAGLPRATSHLLFQLAHAIGRQSAQVEFRWMQQTLSSPPPGIPPSAKNLEEMVARRVSGEPLQYILGSQPFGPLNLAVRRPVLIPRPETEDWTIRLAESLSPSSTRPLNVLDLCTGTGCIPLLLCHLWPPGSAHATGVDISTDAINIATENAALCGIPVLPSPSHATKGQAQNTFTPVLGDLMHPTFVHEAHLELPYDLITSNPPYIPRAEYDELPASVKDFEDVRALLGETPGHTSPDAELPDTDCMKGLVFYHRIATLASRHGLLRSSGGTLALEVGDGQAGDIARIVENNFKARLDRIDIWKDPWGKERVVVART
ncbi:S-adenosyl-L-methionine-dependent methyltransferase [Ganoderma leucocontextum]|nr:S-adenosyl-L-methionine-dependent methyltransferase [Ganoderma leucocontextum]